jgi:hypothetical protein
MSKLLLSLLIALTSISYGYSQCTPNQFGGPSVLLPDSAQGLLPVVAEYNYIQQINIRVPIDTVIPPAPFSFPIDSAGILSINGLPTGLSYVTNSATNFWVGGSYGCVVIQGTVSQSDTGIYYPTVNGEVYIYGTPTPFSYAYKMVVLDSINQGFENVSSNKFALEQNVPNPVINTTKIKFNSPKAGLYQFEVFDMVGNKVYFQSINAGQGVNSIIFRKNTLASGLYFYKLSNHEFTDVRRMIIK